ncbi:MAG: TIGR01777 family oxidoreductase [Acidithiobacillales bacterium]
MNVVVTGGTGFLGRRLVARLREAGHEVVVLSRGRAPAALPPGIQVVPWPEGASGWEAAVDGAGAVVNLAGESVSQRWTAAAKEEIERSRVEGTRRLVKAISAAATKPSVLVNASAVGYYGARGDEELTEDAPPGDDFLAQTCRKWEEAAAEAEVMGVRVVRIRIGLVLAADGGALAKMLPAFRVFAGGPAGRGAQWMSWIHRDDLVELFLFALESAAASGPLNGTAPAPVRNRDFASALGRALRRPALVRAPAPALRLLFGEMATMVLEGQRALPSRPLALGFRFRFPELGEALRDVVGG